VCAGHDDDLVLAVVRDQDQRDPGRIAVPPKALEVDTVFGERGGERLAEAVVAQRAEEAHVRTEPGRGDRLVRALAAGRVDQPRPPQRLPGRGEALDIAEHVHVHRSAHAHPAHQHASSRFSAGYDARKRAYPDSYTPAHPGSGSTRPTGRTHRAIALSTSGNTPPATPPRSPAP